MLHRVVRGLGPPFEHRVISLTDRGALADPIEEAGARVTTVGLKPGRPSPLRVARLRAELRDARPDVVQTWMHHADLLGGILGRSLRRPVVWGIHISELDRGNTPLATRLTVRACALLSPRVPSRIVSCARSAADVHERMGYPRGKIILIPNGVDTLEFSPSNEARELLRRELGLPADALLVGLVARFHPQKDHRTFVEAASFLRDREDVHFVLAGSGVTQDNRDLMRWIASAAMSERMHVLGPRSDTSTILAALDVASLTSSFGEAFPVVVVEGMSCGVPWVVTDVGDSADIVGDTGVSVPARRPDLLAAAWREMLDMDVSAREELGRAARRRALAHFSLERTLEAYAGVYEEVTAI